LTSVAVNIIDPLPIGSSTFPNRENATLYVPAGSKAAYEAADYWKDFKEIIEMEPDVPGDVNGDGKINVVDFTAIANHILGKSPAGFIEKAADVNGDGKVNVIDLTAVANIILYGSSDN